MTAPRAGTSDNDAPWTILDEYVREPPCAQAAIDVFRGQWSSALPPEAGVVAGNIALYDDQRIRWIIDRCGGLEGSTVLELGPLEACHSFMLERAGAQVIAVEANRRAYLKCLVVKELLDLRARFLLGDFLGYLESDARRTRFDLIVASGVLYHAPDPLRLLRAIANAADRVGIWTHYYDEGVVADSPGLQRLFDAPIVVSADGRRITLHRCNYLEALRFAGFCGGPEASAVWMERDDVILVLRDLGFTRIEVGGDDPTHPHGPATLLFAARS